MEGVTPPVVSARLAGLEWLGVVGAGRYGLVYRAFWPALGHEVAVKRLEGDVDHDRCLQEIRLWEKLEHSNIVRLYQADIVEYQKGRSTGRLVSLVMEYAPNGSLYDYLKLQHKERRPLAEERVVTWSTQIADALSYLRSCNVIHRDLKSSNIVLDADYNIKLCDFGSSKFMSRTRCVSLRGTFAWMAPELMRGQTICSVPNTGYSYVDIYSYAMVVWEMLTLEVPFRNLENEFQIVLAVCQYGDRPPLPSTCPDYLRDLVAACWDEVPFKRPSLAEIKQCLTQRDASVIRDRPEGQWTQPHHGLSPIPESPSGDSSNSPPKFPVVNHGELPAASRVDHVEGPAAGMADQENGHEAGLPEARDAEGGQCGVCPACLGRDAPNKAPLRRAATVDGSRSAEAAALRRTLITSMVKRFSLPDDDLALMLGTPADFLGQGLSSA